MSGGLSRRQMLGVAAGLMVGHVVRPLLGQATQPNAPETMLRRNVPSIAEAVPVIGMGTWQTFDTADAKELQTLKEVLKIFHSAGGRVVDSSPMYGRSESVAGELSTQLGINKDLFFATKVWTRGEEQGIRQMNESLAKLKRRSIELMQIHNLLDWKTHLTTLRKWKAEGKFRCIGVTHYQRSAFEDLENIMRAEKLDFVQLPYSIDFRDAEQRLLPAAKETGTAVIVMSPFGGGSLFSKVKTKEISDFAKAFASSWAHVFLKFILANDAVTCVIPATSKPHHMHDNVAAGWGRLPNEEERARLAALFE